MKKNQTKTPTPLTPDELFSDIANCCNRAKPSVVEATLSFMLASVAVKRRPGIAPDLVKAELQAMVGAAIQQASETPAGGVN